MKKDFKKALTCLLASVLCLTMIVPAAFAADSEETEADETSAAATEESQLSIKKTADKDTYSVGESIFYTVELENLDKDTLLTDVVMIDLMPDGVHIKDVTVEGSDDAEIVLIDGDTNESGSTGDIDTEPGPVETTEPDTTTEPDNTNPDDTEPGEEEYSYYAVVTIQTSTDEEYFFVNEIDGGIYASDLLSCEGPIEGEDGEYYEQTYVLYSNISGEHAVDAWSANRDLIQVGKVEFIEIENTKDGGEPDYVYYAEIQVEVNYEMSDVVFLDESDEAIENVLIDSYTYKGTNDSGDEVTYYVYTYALYSNDLVGEQTVEVWGLLDGYSEVYVLLDSQVATFISYNEGTGIATYAATSAETVVVTYDASEDANTENADDEDSETDAGGETEEVSEEKADTIDGVEVYIPYIEYDHPVIVTIEACADAADEYTNTATASSAETDAVSDSVTVNVVESEADDGTGTTSGTGTSGTNGGTGTTGSGTTTTTSPQTGEIIGIVTMAVMALAAGTVLVVTVATNKHKENI